MKPGTGDCIIHIASCTERTQKLRIPQSQQAQEHLTVLGAGNVLGHWFTHGHSGLDGPAKGRVKGGNALVALQDLEMSRIALATTGCAGKLLKKLRDGTSGRRGNGHG